MKRITYEVVPTKRGYEAVRWTEWPDADQRIHAPIPTRIGTYGNEEAAQQACLNDADWQAIAAADAGANWEIRCELDAEAA